MSDAPNIPRTNAELAVQATVFALGLLAGQTVFVSGAGSGMGRATAWLAARLGARVIVGGRTSAKLAAVVDAINAVPGLEAHAQVVDIRERSSVDAAFAAVSSQFGPIDLLVNSAGGQFPQAAIDFSEKGWHAVINTNLHGTCT